MAFPHRYGSQYAEENLNICWFSYNLLMVKAHSCAPSLFLNNTCTLNRVYNILKAPFVFQAIHFLLFDARLAACVGIGLQVHQYGDDLVAEALFGEAADLQVALGQSWILRCEA